MDAFRKSLLAKRSTLSKEQVHVFSKQIQETVSLFIKDDMWVGCYYEMGDEVQLRPLVEILFSRCKVAYPVCEKHGVMKFYQIDENTTYQQSAYGIQEPVDAPLVHPEDFAIILVPMVGFDAQLHRMGHGAGYYDRYLAKTNAFKIGVAFEIQKVDVLDVLPHDVNMDIIITESKLYRRD